MNTSILVPATSGIYQITNVVNSKIYIGSAINIYQRCCHHLSALRNNRHCNGFLQRSWNKYGEDAFVFAVIELVPDIHQLRMREQHYLDTLSPDLNQLPTAGTWLGAKHSEAAKKKMSAAKKGKPVSPEIRAMRIKQLAEIHNNPTFRTRVSAALKGRTVSIATRALLSASLKGRKRSPEVCKALGDRTRGRKASDETRTKMSASRTGKVPTAEHRAHVSEGLKGHFVSEETKAKIRASHLGLRASAEARAKMSEQRKGRPLSEEQKEKLRQAALQRWARWKAEGKIRGH